MRRRRRPFGALVPALVAFVVVVWPAVAVEAATASTTVSTTVSTTASTTPAAPTDDAPETVIYFFWGDGCPHCAAAEPFLADLAERYPGVVVRDFEVWYHPENVEPLERMADALGFVPSGVPVIILGEDSWVGFSEDRTAAPIEAAVAACVANGCPDAGAGILSPASPGASPSASPGQSSAPSSSSDPADAPGPSVAPDTDDRVLSLPFLGTVDLSGESLVLSTVLIAFVDGFNPCSLWVLSVLLALTLRGGSRRTTVIVGLVFIAVTAFVYALFIAGVFSVLTVASVGPWVQRLVALVALAFAIVNIKDYFWWRQGVSFTISDEAKPGIYRRMRRVMASGDSLPALVGGTIVLAAGVSLVEFTCTAGFPVLWVNLLTAQEVTAATFLVLLGIYLLIYQLDELLIFGTAVVTLRASKLQERGGRILKLVGGMLMLTLAAVMLINPALMNDVGTSLLVFVVALAGAGLVLLLHRVVLPRFGVRIGTEEGVSPRSPRGPRR